MGLDMYLDRNGEEVGYWRKANAIHDWFSSQFGEYGLENCEKMRIRKKHLEWLLADCEEVLKSLKKGTLVKKVGKEFDCEFVVYEYDEKTIEEISELLPTASGFFWGGTRFDEYYCEYVKDTIEICKEVIKTTNWSKDVVYYHAWW